MAGQEQDRTLAMLRSMRHSHLNHLQVVLGWLQLDRADRARVHMETLARALASESAVLQRLPGSLGLAMLELGMEAEAEGVTLEWQVEGSPAAPAEARLTADLAQARDELKRAAGRTDGERRLVGIFQSDGSFYLEP